MTVYMQHFVAPGFAAIMVRNAVVLNIQISQYNILWLAITLHYHYPMKKNGVCKCVSVMEVELELYSLCIIYR